jgi:hypothetical protein
LNDAGWSQMGGNFTLHTAVRTAMEQRIRNGAAPREEAQLFLAEAPKILRDIMVDKSVPAGYRIEAQKSLQKTAGDQTPAISNEKFSITINLGKIQTKIETDAPHPLGPPADIPDKVDPQADIKAILAAQDEAGS